MRAQAQFTIHALNDVVTSATAPTSPYLGQLWVDTSKSPPVTMVWNGSAWKEQNGTDTIRTSIKTIETKEATLETNLNGLKSTVSSITKTVETIESDTAEAQGNILALQTNVSELEQTSSGIALRVTKNETNISSLTVSHNSVATRVSTAEGNITSLTADVSGLKTRVTNAEGDISSLEQTASSLSATVSNKADKIGGNNSSFGWQLNSSGFYLYSNGVNVMSVTSSGLVVNGEINALSGTLTDMTVNGRLTMGNNADYYIDANYDDGSYYIYMPGLRIDESSGAVFSGNLSAPSGSICGFTIGSKALYNAKSAYNNTTEGVYLGTDGIGLGAGTFYVTKAGALYASSVDITGKITATSGTMSELNVVGKVYFGESKSYFIGPNVNNGSWYIYLPKFKVDDTSAYFSGTLQAPGGTIGGFTISTSAIYKSKTSYSSSTSGVYIGTDGIGLGAGAFYVTSAGALNASNVNITGGSIKLGSSNGNFYTKIDTSGIQCGGFNWARFTLMYSSLHLYANQWGDGSAINDIGLGWFGGGDTGISLYGINATLADEDFYVYATRSTDYYTSVGYYKRARSGVTCKGHFIGTWTTSSSISVSSDERVKNSIEELPDKYSNLFDSLSPKRFKYNDGKSGRYHTGFIAQDVKASMDTAKVDASEFAGLCIAKTDDGDEWSLRYEEFIAINTREIQKLKAEIKSLKEQIGGSR